MTNINILLKNVISLFLGQMSTIFFGFLFTLYSARYLGASSFGILSFAISFTGLSCLLSDLGLKYLTTQQLSRDKNQMNNYIGNVLFIKIFLAAVAFLFTIILTSFLNKTTETIFVIYILTISTIISGFIDMFNSIFQAFEKMEYIALGRALTSALLFIGALFAMNNNLNLINFSMIYLISSGITLVYSIFTYLIIFESPIIKIELCACKKLLTQSLPFWFSGVFTIIYFKIDMVMLSIMEGNEIVGWYAASYRLLDSLSFIPIVLTSVMFPVFSKFYIDSKSSLNYMFQKSLNSLMTIAIPIAVGTIILADKIIFLIYGQEYIPSVIALRILMIASIINFFNWNSSTFLNSIDKQRILMVYALIGAIFNIAANYFIIPLLSYKGAAIVTVATEFLVALLSILQIQKTQDIFAMLHGAIKKPLLSSIGMGIILYFLKNLPLFIIIPAASGVYFLILLLFNGISKEDIILLKSILYINNKKF